MACDTRPVWSLELLLPPLEWFPPPSLPTESAGSRVVGSVIHISSLESMRNVLNVLILTQTRVSGQSNLPNPPPHHHKTFVSRAVALTEQWTRGIIDSSERHTPLCSVRFCVPRRTRVGRVRPRTSLIQSNFFSCAASLHHVIGIYDVMEEPHDSDHSRITR